MASDSRFSLRSLAVALITLAALGSASARAAVTTYTGTFAGTIAAGDTALLNDGASVSGNVANSGTLQFNITGSSAVADNAIISGTGLVRMTGSGTVSNLFDAQTYTGRTLLENGTLLINFNDRLGNTSSGVTFDGGRLQITNSGVNSTFSTARSMSLVSAGTIDTSTLADGSFDQPAFTGVVSGTGTLTLAAHGLGDGASDAYLRFGGASTYSGTTRITSGVVYASSTAAFGTSTVVLDGGGLVAPAAVTINNAIVLAGTANAVRAWTGDTMNLGGVISGTSRLQKTDNGTVNLNAANTYTGDTRILAGTLNAANYAALAGTTLDMKSGDTGSIGFTVAQTGTYQIGGLTGSRAINNGGDTLAIGGNDASTTYSGTLTGAGALVKTGIGTLTLTGNNSYSGGTVLQGGTLALGSAGAIGSVGAISFIDGTLQYSASNTTDYSARLSNADGQNYVIDTNGYNVAFGATLTSAGGSLTKLGSGTLSLPKDEDSDYLGLKSMSLEVVAGVVSGPGTPDFYVTTGNRFNVSGGRFEGVTTTQIGSPGALATGTISGGVVVTNIQVGSTFFGPAGGHFTFSGGRLDGNLTVGLGSNTTASSVVTGGTVGGATAVHAIGVSGTGTLTMSGGLLQGSEFVIGSAAASTGTVTVSGGTLAMSGSLLVADGGNGSLSIADVGVVSVGGGSNDLQLGGLSSGAGILNIGTGGVAGTLTASQVFRRPGTGNATVNFNHTGTTTFSPALAGTMTVNKLGSGTTNLTAASTFTGTATVSAGELKVNGSLGVASLVNVLSGGALSGTGTIAGATTIAGVHSPGNSPGTQTFTGDLTYTAGAAVNWELIANTTGSAGTLSDQIALPMGNLLFSGSTAMNLSFNGAGSTVDWTNPFWAVDRAWLVYDLSAGTTTGIGNFSVTATDWLDANAATLSSARPGSTFSVGLTGQDVVLNYVAAVPEPGSLAVLAAGAVIGFGLLRRRDRGCHTIASPR